jgi:hypothetical protein
MLVKPVALNPEKLKKIRDILSLLLEKVEKVEKGDTGKSLYDKIFKQSVIKYASVPFQARQEQQLRTKTQKAIETLDELARFQDMLDSMSDSMAKTPTKIDLATQRRWYENLASLQEKLGFTLQSVRKTLESFKTLKEKQEQQEGIDWTTFLEKQGSHERYDIDTPRTRRRFVFHPTGVDTVDYFKTMDNDVVHSPYHIPFMKSLQSMIKKGQVEKSLIPPMIEWIRTTKPTQPDALQKHNKILRTIEKWWKHESQSESEGEKKKHDEVKPSPLKFVPDSQTTYRDEYRRNESYYPSHLRPLRLRRPPPRSGV